MNKLSALEACYKRYIKNIHKWLPDGIINVDLELLHQLDLLHYHSRSSDTALTRYFHVIESEDKLTLANEDFVVWIVPEKTDYSASTYTFIALNKENETHLEMAFVTTGIYNNSSLVLRLLEKFLLDIQSTEDFLKRLHY